MSLDKGLRTIDDQWGCVSGSRDCVVRGGLPGPLAFLEAIWGVELLPSGQTSACIMLLVATTGPVHTWVSTSVLCRFKFHLELKSPYLNLSSAFYPSKGNLSLGAGSWKLLRLLPMRWTILSGIMRHPAVAGAPFYWHLSSPACPGLLLPSCSLGSVPHYAHDRTPLLQALPWKRVLCNKARGSTSV